MNKTLTGRFASEETVKNVVDELVNASVAGIPRDKIFADEEKKEVKVIMPTTTAAVVRDVFEKHGAQNITERDWTQ